MKVFTSCIIRGSLEDKAFASQTEIPSLNLDRCGHVTRKTFNTGRHYSFNDFPASEANATGLGDVACNVMKRWALARSRTYTAWVFQERRLYGNIYSSLHFCMCEKIIQQDVKQ